MLRPLPESITVDNGGEFAGRALDEVVFKEVLKFCFRDSSCGRAEDLLDPHIIRCQQRSEYLDEAVSLWQESVCWQEWHKKLGGTQRFKHYTVYFDDAGSLNVVASTCEIGTQNIEP